MRFFIVLLLFSCLNSKAQDPVTNKKYIFQFNFAIEQHDKRLFNFSEQESLKKLHPEYFGTSVMDLILAKRVFSNINISHYFGFSFRYHKTTFTRPFDHGIFNQDYFRILRNLNQYENLKFGVNYILDLKTHNNFGVRFKKSIFFTFFTKADFVGYDFKHFPYSMFRFSLNSFQIEPEFYLKFKNISLGLGTRLFSMSTVDSIIFGNWIRDDFTNNTIDFNNSFKLTFSLGILL